MKKRKLQALKKDIKRDAGLYLLLALPVLWYIVFKYVPMYGVQIAFRNYNPTDGIIKSSWAGLQYFKQFFQSYYCADVIRNTITLSLFSLIFSFPVPIILALFINEIKSSKFKKAIQNITYMPHFLSIVVVVSMLTIFSNKDYGLFNRIIGLFGAEPFDFMASAKAFQPLYIFSGVWQDMGFSAIIYIAALSSVDPQLYEAASIDGATRMQRILHISIPSIMGTILILFIMRIGNIMSVGFEKVLLMQNSLNSSSSEVISTFIYKYGIQNGEFSYSTAVGLFNSVINLIFLATANHISKKATNTSLW